MSKSKPVYIDVNPINKDNLENSPHKSVALALKNIITNKEFRLTNKVIGLEGEWGSGKSNVIGILDDELSTTENIKDHKPIKKHHIFTYNVWAHQEDLTRRSFLEEILNELYDKDLLEGGKAFYDETLDELSARKKTVSTKSFPKLKIFIFYFLLIPVFLAALKITNDFISNIYGISQCWYEYSKIIVSVLLTAAGIFSFYRSYKEDTSNDSLKDKISKLLYVFDGKEIESHQNENIIEDDPSVTRFKKIFSAIVSHLKCDTLIIVFDNMDRLASKEKLMSVWSSVFTFFSGNIEGEKDKNIWTIIPYDKKHLTALFDVTVPENGVCNTNGCKENDLKEESKRKKVEDEIINEFLNKTFATTFRVPTPIVSSWKKYLSELLNEAFGDLISDDDSKILASLFKYSTDITKIKPRELINYVNNLVSLFIQHNEKKIPIEYLALYSLKKDQIVDNPVNAILDPDYCFSNEKHFFEDQNELTNSIAALFYNLDKNNASEILLKVNIEKSIIDKSIFETLAKTPKFADYVADVINDTSFDVKSYKPEDISHFFLKLNSYLTPKVYNKCWKLFNETVKNAVSSSTLAEWHKNVITQAPVKTASLIANELLKSPSDLNIRSYCESLIELFELKKIRPDFKFENEEKFLKHDDFVYFYKLIKDKGLLESMFDLYKIKVEHNSLLEFLMDSNDASYNLSKTDNREIVEFLYNKGGYVFEELEIKNSDFVKLITYQDDTKIIDQVLILNRILNPKVEVIPTTLLDILTQKKFSESESDLYACIIKSISIDPSQKANYPELLIQTDSARKLTSIIESYFSYNELLKLAVVQGIIDPLIISLIKNLTSQPTEHTTPDFEWILNNLAKIQQVVYSQPGEIYDFILALGKWDEKLTETLNLKPAYNFKLEWFELLINDASNKNHYQNYSFLITLVNKANEALLHQTFKEWNDAFGKNINAWNTFKILFNISLVSDAVYTSESFIKAFEEYIKNYIVTDDPLFPAAITLKIAEHISINRMKTIANSLYLETNGINPFTGLRFEFFMEFFIKYSSQFTVKSNAENVVLKYIRHFSDHKPLSIRLINSHFSSLVTIINNYDGEKEELAFIFREFLSDDNNSSDDKNNIENLMNETKLQKSIPDKKN